MRSVTYSMGVSLDGYIVGPDGGFDWTAPDGEVFRSHIDEIREVGVHLMGRRLYETMLTMAATMEGVLSPLFARLFGKVIAGYTPTAVRELVAKAEASGSPADILGAG